MALKWYGRRVLEKMRRASEAAIDQTMQDAVRYAKANHPGWQSESGTAEQSIRVIKQAERRHLKRGTKIVGQWGSKGVPYFNVLEFKHGKALQNSAQVNYRRLPGYIRIKWKFAKSAARRR